MIYCDNQGLHYIYTYYTIMVRSRPIVCLALGLGEGARHSGAFVCSRPTQDMRYEVQVAEQDAGFQLHQR